MIVRLLLLALNFVVLSSVPRLQALVGGDTRPYLAATILLVVLNAAIVATWRRAAPADAAPTPPHRALAIAAGAAALALLVPACRAWLWQIFLVPVDPQRADMLVVVELGIRRLLVGRNPYTLYHLPWVAPLPYGPMLWGPYVAPVLLGADLRFVTIAGELFVPVACGAAAIAAAWRGRAAQAIAWIALIAAIVFNADLAGFTTIGHTPAYWPLVALFAWLVARERWLGAAIALGLLVTARTTMVSIVPVLLIVVWWRKRDRFWIAAAATATAAVVPFLPFALRDPGALGYALYGSYQHVMKDFLWVKTTAVQHTIGVTGLLLTLGWSREVEIVQVATLLAVYAAAWRAIAKGANALAWMGAALLAFSLTTLWPVSYVYFDPFLLLVCAAIAEAPWRALGRGPVGAWAATLGVTLALVVVTAGVLLPRAPTIEAGRGSDRRFLRAGFGDDEREGDREYAWIEGRHAVVMLPSRSRSDAAVEIEAQPFLPSADAVQEVSVLLNGVPIGTRPVPAGWSRLRFDAPSRAWRIGGNQLELFAASASSPRSAGLGDDPRQLAIEVGAIRVIR